jgi:hypothetical protein
METDTSLALTHRALIPTLSSLGYQEEPVEVQLFKSIGQRTIIRIAQTFDRRSGSRFDTIGAIQIVAADGPTSSCN